MNLLLKDDKNIFLLVIHTQYLLVFFNLDYYIMSYLLIYGYYQYILLIYGNDKNNKANYFFNIIYLYIFYY